MVIDQGLEYQVDLNDPEVWRWIWLIAAVAFAIGEIAIAGTFFLGPFAVGAGAAAVLAFAGVDLGPQWFVFVGVSAVSLAALRPLARRLDAEPSVLGVGAGRQVGQKARVVEAIGPEQDSGFVMLGAERWRAESASGEAFDVGAIVEVAEVRGTRVLVTAAGPAAASPADVDDTRTDSELPDSDHASD